MSRAALPSVRTATGKRPTRGFGKGAALGVLVVIPLISLGIWTATRAGIGDQRPSMIEIVRLVVVFAGIPALATAGGVGRLAAQASAERGRGRGRGRAMWVAARAMALGGVALIVVGAIPVGAVPESEPGWVALAAIGLVAGAGGGVLLGLACAGDMPTLVELGVWPPEGTMGRTFGRVVMRRGRETEPPESASPTGSASGPAATAVPRDEPADPT